jgi:gas vesicle protein
VGSSPEELTREIQQVRGELALTLEAVGDRIAPKKVVARAKADVAERVENVRERVSPTRIIDRRTESLRLGIRSVQESVMGRNDDVARESELEEGRFTGTVRGQSKRLAERTGKVTAAVADRAQQPPDTLRDKTEGNPLVAGLVAFGGGVLLASLLPPSDPERKVARQVKERAEPVKEKAIEAGRSVADQVQQSAQDSTEQVKQQATDAAKQVKQVKQQAKASTQRAKGQAKDAAT